MRMLNSVNENQARCFVGPRLDLGCLHHYIIRQPEHTGICIRRFAGIYTYCRYFIEPMW